MYILPPVGRVSGVRCGVTPRDCLPGCSVFPLWLPVPPHLFCVFIWGGVGGTRQPLTFSDFSWEMMKHEKVKGQSSASTQRRTGFFGHALRGLPGIFLKTCRQHVRVKAVKGFGSRSPKSRLVNRANYACDTGSRSLATQTVCSVHVAVRLHSRTQTFDPTSVLSILRCATHQQDASQPVKQRHKRDASEPVKKYKWDEEQLLTRCK